MAWSDVVDTVMDYAIGEGTVDPDDEDSREDFIDAMYDAFRDPETGDFPDHFPNAHEVDADRWEDIMDFFDEYDLWEDVRADWEDYEKAV